MSALYHAGRPNAAGYRDVTPAEVITGADGVRVVDVREPHEFVGELGHIAAAELIPLTRALDEAPRHWPKEAEIVLVCRSGARSGRVAAALAALGFSRVMNMAGGMLAWNEARLPVERDLG